MHLARAADEVSSIVHADEPIVEIVAKRLVENLERAGFVVMSPAAIGGSAARARGFEG